MSLRGPQELYEDWERAHWAAQDVDLTRDRSDWVGMEEGERDRLPGFVDGYSRIAADEQRHLAYGTQFLQSAVQEDPAMADVVRRRLFDLLPAVAESVAPPSEGAWDVLGVVDGELGAYGLNALTRRLKLIGVSLENGA